MTMAGVVDSRLKKAVDWKIFELQSLLISDDVDQGTVNDSLHWLQERHYLEVIEERANDNRCGYPLCENSLKSKKKGAYRIDYNDKKVYSVEKSHMFCCDQCIEKSQQLEVRFDNSLPYSRKVISTLDLNISSKKGIDDILSLLGSKDDYQNKLNNNNDDYKYITKDADEDLELQSTVSDLTFKGSDIMSNNGELNVEFINGLPVVVPNRLTTKHVKNMSESTPEDRRRINELTKNLSVDVSKKSHIEIQKKYSPSPSSSVSIQASLHNQTIMRNTGDNRAQDPTQSVVYNNIRMDYRPEDIPLDEIFSSMSSVKAKYEAKHQQHSSPKYQDNNNKNNGSPKYQDSHSSPKHQNGSPKYGGGDGSPKSTISVNSIASKKIVNTIDNSNKTIDEIMDDFVITRGDSSLTTTIHDSQSKKKSTTSSSTTIRSATVVSHIGPKTLTWDNTIRESKGVKDSSSGVNVFNKPTTVGSSSASVSSTISSGSRTMHFEVRERMHPTVMSEEAILFKKEPYPASVIKIDGNSKSGIYGRSALTSGALNVLHSTPIEERTYIDPSDISSSHNSNTSNSHNRKSSLTPSMIQDHRPMNTSSIQEHRLHYGITAADTEGISLNKPPSMSEMASSVEGYIMQFNDSIRVAPITTMKNLSYFPFAKKSTTAIDHDIDDDDDDDVKANDAVVVGDSKDDDLYDEEIDDVMDYSQHSNDSQQSLFYIIWSTMDELFPFAASILNDDNNNDSSHIVAIIEHNSNNDSVVLASDVDRYVPVQQINTEAIVMKLLTNGMLSAEKRLNIFQRYLISTSERDQYHSAKGQLLTYANKILRRVALSNAYGPPRVAPTVHSAGWTLIGLLIVEAIIKKKFIGPYFGLDINSEICGNVAVRDWSDKIELMCNDILSTKNSHYSAAYKLRPGDLKILRSFFDCIKA